MSRRSRGSEQGAAVVDFVLVLLVLLPLVLGIVQLALVLHVRNTLTAAASEGARYGATRGHTPAEGAGRARAQIGEAIAGRFAADVQAGLIAVGGAPTVVVRVHAEVPPLGMFGPGVPLTVEGHAVQEVAP